eukprot:SAG22_NODE_3709_length_1563_cov_1.665984_2_plen_121_part_00
MITAFTCDQPATFRARIDSTYSEYGSSVPMRACVYSGWISLAGGGVLAVAASASGIGSTSYSRMTAPLTCGFCHLTSVEMSVTSVWLASTGGSGGIGSALLLISCCCGTARSGTVSETEF